MIGTVEIKYRDPDEIHVQQQQQFVRLKWLIIQAIKKG